MWEEIQQSINTLYKENPDLKRITFKSNGKVMVTFKNQKPFVLNSILELVELIEINKKQQLL